jgi:lysophospholipase L1-like esterase
VDAGGWTSVDTNGAAGYQTTTNSGLDGNSHLLTIEVTVAGAAGVTLLGVDIQLTAEGVRVHRIGNSGLRLAEAAAVDATNWEAALTALGVDVVIFLAGTNDQRDDTAPSVAAGYLNTLIDRVQAAVALADNVVIMFGPNGETHTYETSEYVSEFRDVCVAQGAAWLDLHANIGTYAAGNSRGLYDDAIHLNNTGAYLVANLLYNRLLATR